MALVILAVLAAGVGLFVVTNRPTDHTPVYTGEHELAGADLKYHRQVIERVGNGANYYDAARDLLPQWHFPIGSPFNWRLPTYAYLLAALPGPSWIRATVAVIGWVGLVLCLFPEIVAGQWLTAIATAFLLLGVVAWPLAPGDAYLAPEVWVGMLLVLSVGALGCGVYSPWWRVLAVAAGLLAVCFRELALLYCLVAGVVAWRRGRRLEAGAWLGGVALFGLFLCWHISQVYERVAPTDRTVSFGVAAWIQFGGLGFDLMATRMNGLVMPLPGWLVLLYLWLGLVGLLAWDTDRGRVLAWTTVVYFFAFAVIGQSMNLNWGLLFAAFLPFGVARAPAVLWEVSRKIRSHEHPTLML